MNEFLHYKSRAMIHDYCYHIQRQTREEADRIGFPSPSDYFRQYATANPEFIAYLFDAPALASGCRPITEEMYMQSEDFIDELCDSVTFYPAAVSIAESIPFEMHATPQQCYDFIRRNRDMMCAKLLQRKEARLLICCHVCDLPIYQEPIA